MISIRILQCCKLYEAAVTHETEIAGGYCNIIRADYEGPKTEDPIVDICMENPEGTFVNYKDFQYDFNYQGYIYDRKFLTENDIKFPPYRRFQDPPFFVKAMICAKRFFAIQPAHIVIIIRIKHLRGMRRKSTIWYAGTLII